MVFGETHHSRRTPLNPRGVATSYLHLSTDRRFLIPAATIALPMSQLFAIFGTAPRILMDDMQFSPIQLGLFFAGIVLIVFAAGALATKLPPRFGLDRSVQGALFLAAIGSVAMLLVSNLAPTLSLFLG